MEEALRAVRETLEIHFRQPNAECECTHTLRPEHVQFRERLKEILESECDYQVVEFPAEDVMHISWYHDGYSDQWWCDDDDGAS